MQKAGLKTNWPKLIIGWVVCLILRLIPLRPPNVEPILTTTMPFAKNFGSLYGFGFAFLSIAIYDILTAKIGVWTLVTGLIYGLLGVGAYYFLQNKRGAVNYLQYAIFATLVYDATTGPGMSTLIFNQPFMVSVIGQIPFTINHLVSNIVFAVTISPAINRWVVTNQNLQADLLWKRLVRIG